MITVGAVTCENTACMRQRHLQICLHVVSELLVEPRVNRVSPSHEENRMPAWHGGACPTV